MATMAYWVKVQLAGPWWRPLAGPCPHRTAIARPVRTRRARRVQLTLRGAEPYGVVAAYRR
jgi:hypothetical protein